MILSMHPSQITFRLTNEERRKKLDPSHDPLHNPGWAGNGTNSRAVYLDAEKRRVLKEDYGVEAFTVHQFMGEALFIPAGSPRQVIIWAYVEFVYNLTQFSVLYGLDTGFISHKDSLIRAPGNGVPLYSPSLKRQ